MSITVRLWTTMVLLVLAVLVLAGVVQSQVLKNTFYAQEGRRLLEEGRRLAGVLAESRTEEAARTAENLAEALRVHVMVLDREGRVLLCTGAGGMMGGTGAAAGGQGGAGMRHRYGAALHGMVYPGGEWRQGREVVVRGPNPLFEGQMLTAAVPVLRDGRVDGAVLLHEPLAPLAAQALALQKTALAALGGGLLLATLLSVLLSRGLSRPLVAMRRLADAVARGDYTVRAPVNSRDEVGQLAAALNTLAERLQEKIAELERVDRARREFVASVSHELRTPLTIIQGYTEALLDGLVRDGEETRAHLKEMLEETLRLRRLVDDLLDLGRIEAGALPMARQAVDLAELAARVQERFAGLAGKKGVELTAR
ncbi:MAG: HAMP domain-containing protein, partial [Firmicutes bacterium]|nr:HAMP domain-containing protein [Bacillota bacterium]